MISFDVSGTPAPKGSARAFANKHTGKATLVPGGSAVNRERVKAWASEVRSTALETLGPALNGPVFVDVPLYVAIEFRMARPGGHWDKRTRRLKSSARKAPATKPDIDKLARATLDALTGVAFDDDSRIVRLVVSKTYAQPGQEGAHITIAEDKP